MYLPGMQFRSKAEDGVKESCCNRVARRGRNGRRRERCAIAEERSDGQIARVNIERSVKDAAGIVLQWRNDVVQAFAHVSQRIAAANYSLSAAARKTTEPAMFEIRRPGHADARREVVVIGVIKPLAYVELRQLRRVSGERARLEEIARARDAEEIGVRGLGEVGVLRHNWQLRLPAQTEIERQIGTQSPIVLSEDGELLLVEARHLRAEKAVFAIVEKTELIDRLHA